MESNLNIKILNRDFEIKFVEKNDMTREDILGFSSSIKKILTIGEEDRFATLLHEVAHPYLFHAGVDDTFPISKETFCDMFSKLVENLMIENGDDVFQKLKSLSEGKI